MAINLADLYKIAKLSPPADTIERRQNSLDKLLKDLSRSNAAELIRLYFKLPSRNSLDWFINTFREDDASFSLEGNMREAVILSSYLIEHYIAGGSIFTATALVTTSFSENRKPAINYNLVAKANHAIQSAGLSERKNANINASLIPLTLKSRLGPKEKLEADIIAQPTSIIDNLILVNNGLSSGINNLATNTKTLIEELAAANNNLTELTNILWWHIGAWSETLNCPLEKLSLPECAIVIGIDLAELSHTIAGPVAAPAVLFRTIQAHPSMRANKKITVAEGINSLQQKIEKLPLLEEKIDNLSDICPLINAMIKAKLFGGSDVWSQAFTQSSHLSADISLSPFDLAMQSYREHLACYAYKD